MPTLAVLARRAAMAIVSSENLAGVFSPRRYNRIFLLLLLVNVFASLEQVFCYNRFADLHRHGRRRTSLDFFLLRCYISIKIMLRHLRRGLRQNHFAGKNCYDASIVQKNAPTSPARSPARSTLFCFEPFFATTKQKRGFFCFTKAILGF
jgi:hypothetical protein